MSADYGFCPILSKTELHAVQYGAEVRVHPSPCQHSKCALWTRYGCGLSHNITEAVGTKEATP
jgi:hypothetical protein